MTDLLRCAIYTRKSSEEGLEQEFNSLHAQREACEAFTLAHRHEGWRALPQQYDDGGWSGGNMDRPALKQMLADVAAGLIDLVIVYKVDRLSRSLSDFVKIIEALDAKNVSFVSVTQAFNTNSSMGRLTLNVLLSFAQFEREVTGERIRDKIAASKRKGMWMGGYVPLGYDWIDRKLVVNEVEAERVRALFQLYLDLDSVDQVCAEASRRGIVSKVRPKKGGGVIGGGAICRGALYDILKNPIYIGMIAHRGEHHPGLHPPILDQDTFSQVQALIARKKVTRRYGMRTADPSLLTGLLFDEAGRRFGPAATAKGPRRYRYYVAAADGEGGQIRYPAHLLEQRVVITLSEFLSDAGGLIARLRPSDSAQTETILSAAGQLRARLDDRRRGQLQEALCDLLARVTLRPGGCVLSVRASALVASALPADTLEIDVPGLLIRRAGQMQYLSEPQGAASAHQDPALLNLLGKAQVWFDQLSAGEGLTMRQLAQAEGVTDMWISQVLELAFLSPEMKRLILQGKQPPSLTASRLKSLCPLPMSWDEQRELIQASEGRPFVSA